MHGHLFSALIAKQCSELFNSFLTVFYTALTVSYSSPVCIQTNQPDFVSHGAHLNPDILYQLNAPGCSKPKIKFLKNLSYLQSTFEETQKATSYILTCTDPR